MSISSCPSQIRRHWLFGAMAAFTTVISRRVPAQAQSGEARRWQPEVHEKDGWLDRIPGKHRLVFDTTTPDGFGTALLYANNYFAASKDGYDLQDSDLAVVIIARHHATPFAFNDSMWKKYGDSIAKLANLVDPKTKQSPTVNLYNGTGYASVLSNRGTTLDSMLKRGVQLAVCEMAARDLLGSVAQSLGTDVEGVFTEVTRNLVANAHLVPAGIVAVNRAQERGYTFVNA